MDSQQGVHALPLFEDAAAPNFLWGEIDGESFAHSADYCYAEIVHWKRDLYKIPSGIKEW